MLDGVLYHESDLDLEEHYTDTHRYSEINFAAFGTVGMRFCPRLRSLHRQRIYCADPDRDHGVLEPVLKRGRRAVNFRLIAEQWDRIGQFSTRRSPRGTPRRRPTAVKPGRLASPRWKIGRDARSGGGELPYRTCSRNWPCGPTYR